MSQHSRDSVVPLQKGSQYTFAKKTPEFVEKPYPLRRKLTWIAGGTLLFLVALGLGAGLGVGLSLRRNGNSDDFTIYTNTSLASVNWTLGGFHQYRVFFQDTRNRLWEAAANRSINGIIDSPWRVSRVRNVFSPPRKGTSLAATVGNTVRNGVDNIEYRIYYADNRNVLRELDCDADSGNCQYRRQWFRLIHPSSNIAAYHIDQTRLKECNGQCDVIFYQDPGNSLRQIVLSDRFDGQFGTPLSPIPNFRGNNTRRGGPVAEPGGALGMTRWTINGTDRLYLFYTPTGTNVRGSHFVTYADLGASNLTWSEPNTSLRFSSSTPTKSITALTLNPDANNTNQTNKSSILVLSPGYFTNLAMWSSRIPVNSSDIALDDEAFTYNLDLLSDSASAEAASARSYAIASNQAGRFYAVREDGIHQYFVTGMDQISKCLSESTLGCMDINGFRLEQACPNQASYYC